MNLLNSILQQISGISKPKLKFMLTLIKTIIAVPGKITFRNLSRYCHLSEKTISRNFRKTFDFLQFNLILLKNVIDSAETLLLAIDCTFIEKSGKKTYGLAKFYNGSNQRPEKGLELCLVSLVEPVLNTAFALLGKQTPPEMAVNVTRADFYLQCLQDIIASVPQKVKYLVADGFFAKSKFAEGVLALKLNLISKLRADANLKFLYNGEQKQRGRPKVFDGKVKFDDISRFERVTGCDDYLSLYTTVAYCVNLCRKVRIALLVNKSVKNKYSYAVLFSTNPEQDALEIYKFYKSRFQIEFIFRDTKQFCGLGDCQARKKEAIAFHINASFSVLNCAKIEALSEHDLKEEFSFSMATAKRKAYNELFLEKIFSMLDFDLSLNKFDPVFKELIDYGSIAA